MTGVQTCALPIFLHEFEIETRTRRKAVHLVVLNQFLIDKYSEGKRAVLIVDEAQNLSWSALEEIRMLSNLQTEQEPLLQIVLVGQPALQTKLRDPSLSQLSQRISVSYHLSSLNFAEAKEYIAHRLKKAGTQK